MKWLIFLDKIKFAQKFLYMSSRSVLATWFVYACSSLLWQIKIHRRHSGVFSSSSCCSIIQTSASISSCTQCVASRSVDVWSRYCAGSWRVWPDITAAHRGTYSLHSIFVENPTKIKLNRWLMVAIRESVSPWNINASWSMISLYPYLNSTEVLAQIVEAFVGGINPRINPRWSCLPESPWKSAPFRQKRYASVTLSSMSTARWRIW